VFPTDEAPTRLFDVYPSTGAHDAEADFATRVDLPEAMIHVAMGSRLLRRISC